METVDQQEEALRLIGPVTSKLKSAIFAIVRDTFETEDVFSEVTTRILKAFSTFDPERPFDGWAVTIAKRIAFGYAARRSKAREVLDPEVLDRILEQVEVLEIELPGDERRAHLGCCVGRLPPKHHLLVRLFYYQGHKYPELADYAELSLPRLHSLFSRVHKNLRECILHRMEKQ